MPQVEVTINDKPYRIACEAGQEDRVRQLAGMVNAHVGDLVSQLGPVDHSRLLVMASLMVADELLDLRDAAHEVSVEAANLPEDLENRVAEALESLADRIDTVAANLEGA